MVVQEPPKGADILGEQTCFESSQVFTEQQRQFSNAQNMQSMTSINPQLPEPEQEQPKPRNGSKEGHQRNSKIQVKYKSTSDGVAQENEHQNPRQEARKRNEPGTSRIMNVNESDGSEYTNTDTTHLTHPTGHRTNLHDQQTMVTDKNLVNKRGSNGWGQNSNLSGVHQSELHASYINNSYTQKEA